MKIHTIITAAAVGVFSVTAYASTPVDNLLNNVGVYGEYAGITNSGESSSGGIGARAEGYWNGFYGDADLGYTFGTLSSAPAGHSTLVNLKLGYGLSLGNQVVVGPYLGYQYFGNTNRYDGLALTDSNNALGGGLFAAWAPDSRWGVQGHIGYLDGVSSSLTDNVGDGYSQSAANLLSVGAEVDYRISGPWSVFTALHYDHYMESGQSLNLLRGVFGASVSF